MNYYYDIILNWGEEEYEFYEWYDTDALELVKKIPIFRVKHRDFMEMVENQFQVERDFLDLICDKTLISGKNLVNKIKYAALITDVKNTVALEFNENGEVISRSNILLDDDASLFDVAYGLKEKEIKYDILCKRNVNKTLRAELEAKKVIRLELNHLYENKNLAKLKYLYYEYMGEESEDIDRIYQTLNKELDHKFNPKLLNLYHIIKLTYNKA